MAKRKRGAKRPGDKSVRAAAPRAGGRPAGLPESKPPKRRRSAVGEAPIRRVAAARTSANVPDGDGAAASASAASASASASAATVSANVPAPAAAAEREADRRPLPPFIVVGIGASAGGLEACTALFNSLPPNTGMAFVLVQHLAPRHVS